MPVTYSFVTTFYPPVSDEFKCLDLDSPYMLSLLSIPGVVASRGSPWLTFDGYDDVVIKSNDNIATILYIPLNISQRFTFETTFRPYQLPTNLSDLNKSRFFVAAFDKDDNAGGILISKSGIAIVSAFGTSVLPIAGSQNIFVEGSDYYTMRMVVDGFTNVMDLYITKTADLTITGHILRYTVGAPISPATAIDSLRVEIMGQPSAPTQGNFSTFRCNCTELVIPNKRPIADVGADQTITIGSVVQADGTGSYDPEGEPLTYLWTFFGAPDSSIYKIDGNGGFTQDDSDGDGFTTIFEATGDPWSAANAPDLQPGDVLLVDGIQYVVDSSDWTIGASGLYERGGTFDPNKLRCVEDTIPDNLSGKTWDLFYQHTFWSDRTSPQPTFIPDITGIYDVQLVVNDGVLDSLPDTGLINISESDIPFGYIPDVNFIWDYLSDAWNLYDDRDPITTCWSGFAQIASNLLLTAWQYDYGKSLVDIQRQFQRRWLSYNLLFEEPINDRDNSILRIIRGRLLKDITGGKSFSATGETFIISKDGTSNTITFAGTYTAQEIVDEINLELGDKASVTKIAQLQTDAGTDYLSLEYSGVLVVHKEGTANVTLGFSTTQDEQNDFIGSNGTAAGAAFTVADPFVNFSSDGVLKDDLVILDGIGYSVLKIALAKQLTLQQEISYSGSWKISSYIESANTDFTSELVSSGDVLILEVRQPNSHQIYEVQCEIEGVRNKQIGFNPRALYEFVAGAIDDYEVVLKGVKRVNAIPVNDLVAKIPRLQEIILDPPEVLTCNLDYSIATNSDNIQGIFFKEDLFSFDNQPPDQLWAEQTFFDNKPMIENNFGRAVDFTVEQWEKYTSDLDYLSAVRGLWYAFYNGPSLYNIRLGTQILLGLPFSEVTGTIEDINPTYSASKIRVLIRDQANTTIVRSYLIPRNVAWEADGESMIEINPDTGVEYEAGDTINQYSPLSKGVVISDYVSDPEWWLGYNNQGVFLEINKFFHFLAMADVDVFNITNLVFAMDFVRKIKPHYTYPIWVALKRLPPDTISITDNIEMSGYLHLVDDPACKGSEGTGGSYRFDDTDESGNMHWAFDGSPLGGSSKQEFLYDKRRLCPEESVVGIITAYHSGGVFPFDWIWAFDNGGGNDVIPLSGPLGSPPPSGGPYGSLVGVIKFDTSYSAGYYTRGKILAESEPL